jgi:transcriptional regulator with XRE-family HTH domain
MDPIKDALTRPGGVATRLHALRTRAGLAAKDLAETNSWHPSKVSRLENGRQTPSAADVSAWARACGADEQATEDLLRILEDAQAEHRSWRLGLRRGQAQVQAGYNDLARNSHLIRHFETTAVPGLLQTPAYAREMFVEMARLHGLDAHDVDAAVATRAQRQQLLYDPDKTFEFLLAEPVLRWLLCPADVMRGQLDRLQTVIGVPNVRFGVLPMGVQLSAVPQNSVVLYIGEQTVAAVETFVTESFHHGDDAEAYSRAVDRLWEDAVTGEHARELIVSAARALPD